MGSALVSIVLPTFNRVKLLGPTLDSVFAQTTPDWELIIADDGSNDETRAFLRALCDAPRVRLIALPHSGAPAIGRNAALREARGAYVAFLDSDDLWDPRKLEAQVEALRRRPACRWSYTAFTLIDARGALLAGEVDRGWDPYQGDIFEQLVTGAAAVRTPSVLARRDLIAEAGPFDETIRSGEDYDLWIRMALRSPIALVDEPLVHIRSHPEQHTNDWSSAFAGRDRFLTKLQDLVEGPRRALLQRERARNAALLAVQHAARSDRRAVARTLWESLPYAWRYRDWWEGVGRSVVRPLLPASLVALGRATRRGPR